MGTWGIIRQHFTAGTTPGSLGETKQLNDAADLFLALYHKGLIADKDGKAEFENDLDLTKALLRRRDIMKLKEAGVLS